MIKKIFKHLFKSSYIKLFFWVIIYRIALDFIFKNILAVHYTYYNFKDQSTYGFMLISWGVLFLFTYIASYTYKNTMTVCNQILFFLFLISIVPFTTMIGYGNFTTRYIVANSIYFIVLYIFNRVYGKFKKTKITFNMPGIAGKIQLKIIGILSFLVVIYISWRYTGFRFSLGISNAIDWRYDAMEYNLPTIFRYLFSWTKCINSMLMVYFIIKRKLIWVVVCITAQILAFGINGMKFTLFIGFVAFVIAWLPKFDILKVGSISLAAITFFSVLAVLEYVVFHTWYLASFIAMRILFIPNRIGFLYFDFFSTHTPDYFRGSFLKYFGFQTPYPNLRYLITEYYTGSAETGSNNGLIADAMTNLGLIGIIIFPVILIVILKILDKTMENLDVRIKVSQAVSQTLIIISTFFFPMLLTDGLLIMMVLFHAMRKQEKISSNVELKIIKRKIKI